MPHSFETLQLHTGRRDLLRPPGCLPIAELLEKANLTKSQVDGLVVVDGPGSFTGLRVGLSTVKALCEALRKPLAAVSMLEALAVIYGHDGEVVTAVLDAGRGELYVGEYEVRENWARLVQQSIEKLDGFAAATFQAEISNH